MDKDCIVKPVENEGVTKSRRDRLVSRELCNTKSEKSNRVSLEPAPKQRSAVSTYKAALSGTFKDDGVGHQEIAAFQWAPVETPMTPPSSSSGLFCRSKLSSLVRFLLPFSLSFHHAMMNGACEIRKIQRAASNRTI